MGIRPGTGFTVEDLDYIGRGLEDRFDTYGTAEILNSYKEKISAGQPMDGISELGHLHRQLLQESDFHAAGKTLLKKLNPAEENEKFGFNGAELPEELKAVLLLLESLGQAADLKKVINLADGDKDTIQWITNNWETFLNVDLQDAMAKASRGLTDVKDDNSENDTSDQFISQEKGYSKDSYRVVEVFRKNAAKEASERRLVHQKARLRDIQKCTDLRDIEKQRNQIREAYAEDKALLSNWTLERREEDRKLYLESLHKRGFDYEAIRRKMWFAFDREQTETVIEKKTRPLRAGWVNKVNPANGEIPEEAYLSDEEIADLIKRNKPDPRTFVAERIVSSVAFWEEQTSRAYCDLNQTKSQWNKIYDYLWEQATKIIIWKLKLVKKSSQGMILCGYIYQYRFHIDMQKLGEAILKKTRQVQTEKGKDFIRKILTNCYHQLNEEIRQEIVEELRRERTLEGVRRCA
jgi:hypothetical protein